MMFKDRTDAAIKLKDRLFPYQGKKDTLILAIPRGGVEIGYVLAKELRLPLDILMVKKISHPGNPEFAIGATGITQSVINEALVEQEGIPNTYLEEEISHLQTLISESYRRYTGRTSLPDLFKKTIIVVDDGMATGYTLLAALDVVRKEAPEKIIVAVPMASKEAYSLIKEKTDDLICLDVPSSFLTVGEFYSNFREIEDEEVILWLEEMSM